MDVNIEARIFNVTLLRKKVVEDGCFVVMSERWEFLEAGNSDTSHTLMTVEDAGERGISVIKADISYKVFLDEYLRPLKPCIISGLTDGWTAAKEWTIRDSSTGTSIPNFSILKETFGKYECCVTFCDEADANGDIVQREMPILQFINQQNSRKTYLKDFHFMRVKNPSINQRYSVSKSFPR